MNKIDHENSKSGDIENILELLIGERNHLLEIYEQYRDSELFFTVGILERIIFSIQDGSYKCPKTGHRSKELHEWYPVGDMDGKIVEAKNG